MARGFESKSVADQQESREQERGGRDRDGLTDAATATRRRGLELARADVLRRIAEARAEAHRAMLRKALAALEADLAKMS